MLVAVAFLTSCAVSNRIIKIDDPYKEMKSIKLVQNPKTISAEKTGSASNRRFSLTSTYLFEEGQNTRPEITLDIQIITPLSTDELDSVMFFSLNNEKIRLVSDQYKRKRYNSLTSTPIEIGKEGDKGNLVINSTTESGTYQLMNRQFSIPENLWTPIIFSQDIQLRFYIGKQGIDVKPNMQEILKLKEFFKQAVQQLIAKFPDIPEGKKKW